VELADAYTTPQMQRVYKAVAESVGDMTKVNGDSLYPVLNMLNTKYFILPLQGGQTVAVQNPYTYGNAWFVDKVEYVNNANEELDKIGQLKLRHEAVADAQFKEQLGDSQVQDAVSVVTLNKYEPNQLTYDVNSSKGGVVVFSEIYYPGWTATIDGQEAQLGRVDYVLRALKVPSGKHEVVLTFKPRSVEVTEHIAYVSLGILLILVVLAVFVEYRKRKA
jgi:hypothetical protein